MSQIRSQRGRGRVVAVRAGRHGARPAAADRRSLVRRRGVA